MNKVIDILYFLAAAYGGHSQYGNAEIGHALAGQINNNGLGTHYTVDELVGYAVDWLQEQWNHTDDECEVYRSEITAACNDRLSRLQAPSNQKAFCRIIDCLHELAENNVPNMAFIEGHEEDGEWHAEQWSAHWGECKDAMEDHLGRPLTAAEVTCLSLTRCWGPLPLLTLSAAQTTEMYKIICPEFFQPHFTGVHVALDWADLDTRLCVLFNNEAATFL
jgi:hypothetical protein